MTWALLWFLLPPLAIVACRFVLKREADFDDRIAMLRNWNETLSADRDRLQNLLGVAEEALKGTRLEAAQFSRCANGLRSSLDDARNKCAELALKNRALEAKVAALQERITKLAVVPAKLPEILERLEKKLSKRK